TEKMALLAPMPSAIDRMAAIVTPGLEERARHAERRSGMAADCSRDAGCAAGAGPGPVAIGPSRRRSDRGRPPIAPTGSGHFRTTISFDAWPATPEASTARTRT